MESGFKQTQKPIETPKKSGFKDNQAYGLSKITSTIGRGDDAKNSLVYLTLKWSFISGIVISGLIVLNHWFFRQNLMIPNFMGDIKVAWEIIVPIITLALGYAFGKSQK